MGIFVLDINNIISFIHSQGLFFTIYVYFIISVLLLELSSLFFLNFHLIKLGKNINIDSVEKDPFLEKLIKKYKKLLNRQYDMVNTRSFIDSYFSKNSKIKFYLINLIENSGFFFLLLGIIGAFAVMLSAIVSVDFQGLTGFQGLYSRLEDVIYTLKPALFFIIISIISAIVINILSKIFDINSRFDKIKTRLENYLENNLKYKYNRELKQLDLFEKLIEVINSNFMGLEDVIEDSINDSFTEINETILNYIKLTKSGNNSKKKIKGQVASTEEEND